MSNFIKFRDKLDQHIKTVSGKYKLFTTKVSGDTMWETYLSSFPKGSDPLYKTNTWHDCHCCRRFIKTVGSLVYVEDGGLHSVWELDDLPFPYDVVVEKMADKATSYEIETIFLHDMSTIGEVSSFSMDDEGVHTWDHFFCNVHKSHVESNGIRRNKKISDTNTSIATLKRLLEEVTLNSAECIIELIDQGTLYRGDQFRRDIDEFIKVKKEYDLLQGNGAELFLWTTKTHIHGLRNTAIGSLLCEISEGVDVDIAVRKFENIVAPTNYQRPKAIFTKKMVKDAEETLRSLGLLGAMNRRYATADDINIGDVLFVNRNVRRRVIDGGSVFDQLETATKPKLYNKVTEVSAKDFISKILPHSNQLEVLVENKHEKNLVSLIAPVDETPPLFQWDNNFSWCYNGNLTDSNIKANVSKAGGKIDGVLRFSIQWNEEGKTNSDYDAHCYLPNNRHIYFRNKKDYISKGQLDVDIISPNGKVAVENITWPSFDNLPTGKYEFKVHCFSKGYGHGGFNAEIEFDKQVYSFSYPHDLRHGEYVTVATVSIDAENRTMKFVDSLESTMVSQEKQLWGIKTGDFVNVSMVIHSPNYWQQEVGNKHTFFMLDGCINDGKSRGLFNEYLRNDLKQHRKVFEALGDKINIPESSQQLSGVGFSSTLRESVVVRVTGKTKRVVKINF